MDCPKCGAPVPPRAEFCQECGTPTSPGLRNRVRASGAPAEDDAKRKRRSIFVIGAAFVFGLVIGGQSNWFGFDFDSGRGHRQGRPAVVSAQQMFEAYREDADEADDRFGRRHMVVTGEFTEIRSDDQGNPDLRFRTSDPAAPLGADLVRRSYDAAGRLRPGQIVTVSCEGVSRTREERWLRDCSIEQVLEGEAAPAEPAESSGQEGAP